MIYFGALDHRKEKETQPGPITTTRKKLVQVNRDDKDGITMYREDEEQEGWKEGIKRGPTEIPKLTPFNY